MRNLILPIARQQGMTLVVGLVMLLIMTLIGTTAINISVTDTKIATNAKDRQIAFTGAETALATAEDFMGDPEYPPKCSAAKGDLEGYLDANKTGVWWSGFDWATDAGAIAVSGSGADEAAYVIEAPIQGASPYKFESLSIDTDTRYNYYKVTAKGEGPGNSETYLQSVFLLRQRMTPDC